MEITETTTFVSVRFAKSAVAVATEDIERACSLETMGYECFLIGSLYLCRMVTDDTNNCVVAIHDANKGWTQEMSVWPEDATRALFEAEAYGATVEDWRE